MVTAPPPPPGSPPARRVRPPRWLDLRLVAGVALVLLAVVAGARVVGAARHTDRVLALRHDVAAGTVLTADELSVVEARVPAGHYVQDRDAAVGKVVTRPLGSGELLPRAALSAAPARTTVTIPLGADDAPALSAGQRIEVWLSAPACRSVVLLADVAVQQVGRADSSFGTGTGQKVVLSVAPDLAQRVMTALAIDKAVLRAGVLSGGELAAPAAASLPPLTECVAEAP